MRANGWEALAAAVALAVGVAAWVIVSAIMWGWLPWR